MKIDLPILLDRADGVLWHAAPWVWDNGAISVEPPGIRECRKPAMIETCAPEAVSTATDVPVADGKPSVELESLVQAMARGDASALTELYDATVGKVVTITRAILRNTEDAEEVTCDVYTRAWQTAHKFDRSRGSVIGWL